MKRKSRPQRPRGHREKQEKEKTKFFAFTLLCVLFALNTDVLYANQCMEQLLASAVNAFNLLILSLRQQESPKGSIINSKGM